MTKEYCRPTSKKLAEVAEDVGDIVSNDLAVQPVAVHIKFEWMLSVHLED